MNKEIWEIWLEDEERREKDFHRYSKSKKVKREIEIQELVKGHIDKADHNLKFTNSILEAGKFNDWAVVSAYYSIYHVSLALCALKGYSTKDHLATLLILIREFYKKELNKEDIEVIGNATIKKEEVLYYIEAKAKRTIASYSTQKVFDKNETKDLRVKAISFVNKAKEIIDSFEE